jgi:ComF family protein
MVRACIRGSKYSSRQFQALKRLVKYGVSKINLSVLVYDHIVIPIPLARQKAKKRGFNQAELISRQLSDRFDLKHENSILTRERNTKSQYGLNREQRFKNISGAFFVPEPYQKDVRGKKLLLVDDISTSGATFLEAARVLHQSGAHEVRCFSLSKKL